MTDQPQPLDLDAIEARNEAYTVIHLNSGEFANCSAADSANDVPALVAEVRRLTADVGMWRRTVTRTEQGRDRAIADNDRLTAELQQARQQTAHEPIECGHQAEAGQLAEQVKQLRAALHSIESDAERAARKGYDLDAEDIRTTAHNALTPAAVSGA